MNNPLVSICIPTYNGETTIKETLDSILRQITSKFEIIISDDRSNDSTFALAKEYSNKYPALKVYQNENNKGMDGNFHQSIKYAAGEYIWYCGQDDIFLEGAIQKVLDILSNHKNIGLIYLNFFEFDHDMVNCITPSGFGLSGFDINILKNEDEIILNSNKEYFKIFHHPPTFLPAIIMYRQYWDDPRTELFYGTHYVQTGLLLLHMNEKKSCIVPEIFIKGRVPDDKWQTNGQQLFNILLGYLKALTIANKLSKESVPRYTLYRNKFQFLINLPFLIYHCKKLGYDINNTDWKTLSTVFGHAFLYFLYIRPIMLMPLKFLHKPMEKGIKIKNYLLKFRIVEQLKH